MSHAVEPGHDKTERGAAPKPAANQPTPAAPAPERAEAQASLAAAGDAGSAGDPGAPDDASGNPDFLAVADSAAREHVIETLQKRHGNHFVQRVVAQQVAYKQLAVQREPKPGEGLAVQRDAKPAEGLAVQREAKPGDGLIVEDSAQDVSPQQMKRSTFIAQLRAAVNTAVDQSVGSSTFAPILRARAMEQIEQQFAIYGAQDGKTLERSIRAQVAGAGGVSSAQALIPLISEQVRQQVRESVPKEDGAAGVLDAGASAVSSLAKGAGDVLSQVGSLLFKTREGGAPQQADPQAVRADLGAGQSLEPSVRSPMEAAFGADFSSVRVHTDGKAAQLSDSFNARAFTIGDTIAFGAGEYQPGSPVGDALVAHELAHVAQQRGAGASALNPMGPSETNAIEDDADRSALGVVASLWGGAQGALGRISREAMPSLRSGLRLSRCSKNKPEIENTDPAIAKHIQQNMNKLNQSTQSKSLDSGVWYWPEYQDAIAKDPGGTHTWDESKYRQGYSVAPGFTFSKPFTWTLNQGASASASLKAWLKGLTVAECASSTTAIFYDSIRASVGDSKFDDYFEASESNIKKGHRLVIREQPDKTPLKDFLRSTDSQEDGIKVGDWYYWKNHPSYKFKHPAGLWRGENAVYLGEDTWSGFGTSEESRESMLQKLFKEYNDDRTSADVAELDKIKADNNGTLPPEYVYVEEGGKLLKEMKDRHDVEKAGGGLNEKGWRINTLSVQGLKNK